MRGIHIFVFYTRLNSDKELMVLGVYRAYKPELDAAASGTNYELVGNFN